MGPPLGGGDYNLVLRSPRHFAVRVGLYLYIIFYQRRVYIIDQVELWTPLYTGYIFTPFVKYFTSERLIIG